MSVVSFQDRDNVIYNRVTIVSGLSGGASSLPSLPAIPLEVLRTGGLPCPIEEIVDHQRIDDPEAEEDLLVIMARAAAAFIARRTAFVLCPTDHQIILDDPDFSTLNIERGPLREDPVIEIQTARDVWEAVSPDDYWATRYERSFKIRKVDGSGSWARPWQSAGCVRVRFSAGYDAAEESGGLGLEIEPGLKMILFLITGHYYKNRDMLGLGSSKIGLDAVDVKGAEALLGPYRQLW